MNSQVDKWDKTFKDFPIRKPRYDDWLDKHKEILTFSEKTPIIDLGCGFGGNTLYLFERGYDVISCDFSEEALKRLKKYIPYATARKFNMLSGLPFKDDSKKVIIADLSIHYFLWEDTKKIIKDLKRILVKEGVLLCRVNSINDINYGAGQGIKIEENYFNINGRYKRFFDEKSLKCLFKDWEILYLGEDTMKRYVHEKILWEVVVGNKNKSL